MVDTTLLVVVSVLLLLVNTVGVFLVLMQLPGTWLMLGATVGVAWWRWDGWSGAGVIGGWTLVVLLVLALVGELVEFLGPAMGAVKEKSSRRAAVLAVVGGVVGAIVGTVVLVFLPVVGTLIGAVVGSGLFSMMGDLWAGRGWEPALRGGKGAAVGRFWGALGKLMIAVAMWVVVAWALVWV
jgi:uncharacterized protein